MRKKLFFIILSISALFAVVYGNIPNAPKPPRLVNDFAQVLTAEQRITLENDLAKYSKRTSTQIVFVSVSDFGDYDKSEYAFELGEKWGVGQKNKDNGVVILFKPRNEFGPGEVFIATGYGLEGVIPDAVINRIIDVEMIPRFKMGDIYGGIYAGVKVMKELSLQEFSASDYMKRSGENTLSIPPFWALLILSAIFFVLFGNRQRHYTTRGSLPFWATIAMLNSLNRRSGGGAFRDFSSGSGSFGGFGGGSFGGGGAGGSW